MNELDERFRGWQSLSIAEIDARKRKVVSTELLIIKYPADRLLRSALLLNYELHNWSKQASRIFDCLGFGDEQI